MWVIRRMPGQSEPARIRVSVREAKLSDEANIRLTGGDTVSVEETPLTFFVDTLGRFVRVGMSRVSTGLEARRTSLEMNR